MKSKKLANKRVKSSTQKYLDIAELKEDCVVLKDGTLRAVLLVSSVNFSLKSEDEQNAIISSYVGFLNHLEFPLQIVIQSRRLDIDGYLGRLAKMEKEHTNELLRMQTADYRAFVGQLVEIGDIMTKRFYMIIPYNPLSDKQKSFFQRLTGVFTSAKEVKLNKKAFERRSHALNQRIDQVVSGLMSMGLKSVRLDTQGLIELYYNTYNPDVYDKEKLVGVNKLRIDE